MDFKVVSFTFDDAPKSAFKEARGILNEHGIKGTYYVSLSFMNNESGSVQFDQTDLQNCVEENHELACHTYGHIHFLILKGVVLLMN